MSFKDAAHNARQALALAKSRPDEVQAFLAQALVDMAESMNELAQSLDRDIKTLQRTAADVASDVVALR
jgi:predicted transcriptional regulator